MLATLPPPLWPPVQARFAALGAPFVQEVAPSPLPLPRLLHFNAALGAELGLDAAWSRSAAALDRLAGNAAWPGYAPLASVYSGHQFGRWAGRLGDGRALLIAEIRNGHGQGMELQLKGAGPTPYSRGADGRAVLRSSIREYLCSEAMHALGVPTTRALTLVASPLPVIRESVETAAVVCRVAPSFVRFGHFEHYAQAGRVDALATLADHLIAAHHPELAGAPDRHARWLGEVIAGTARMIAYWQTLGFCHGVMNTDNFSILGLTLDYGPFGFMDAFRAHHVCNHSDHEGRYAYQAQPEIGQWNCARLLEACLPLLDGEPDGAREKAQALHAIYRETYNDTVMARWRAKLGLREARERDAALVNRLLALMQASRRDFTLGFRALAKIAVHDDAPAQEREHYADAGAFDRWTQDYRERLRAEGADDDARAARMNRVNPLYVLRNHLAQAAIDQAQSGDSAELTRLAAVLARPYDEQAGMQRYALPPAPGAPCVDVGCSS
ncbi:MAG: protein adenylyltransferase SelO [Pseudomonadota bacterium]